MADSRIRSYQGSKVPYIDKHQFIEAISIVAVVVYQNEPSKIKRVILKLINQILYLLERMNESEGAIKT